MTVAKMKKSTIVLVKKCTHGFLESLMMNSLSDFDNSKRQIQDHGCKNEKKNEDIGKNMYSGVFGDTDNKSIIRFS